MRDCVFLVADSNMAAAFRGFLTRERFYRSLSCGVFHFDPREDLIVDEAGCDPGVYSRAHELLRPYLRTHRYAVVALDNAWDGSPGSERIVAHISNNLQINGWGRERFAVAVIEPELETWLWQDNPHVAEVFRYRSQPSLRVLLTQQGLWDALMVKPARPKEAVEYVLRLTRRPRSSVLYAELASRVSVAGCIDTAFQHLAGTLRMWFPPEGL
jgi:hypothetical protein